MAVVGAIEVGGVVWTCSDAAQRSLAALQRGGYSARDDTIFLLDASSPTKLSSRAISLILSKYICPASIASYRNAPQRFALHWPPCRPSTIRTLRALSAPPSSASNIR